MNNVPVRSFALFCLAFACCVGACSDHSSDGNAASAKQAIVNGDVVADPPGSGVVYISSAGFDTTGSFGMASGSGTLLDAQWVLTAAHVVYSAAVPDNVTVRRGNAGDPAEVRHGKRIDIHPGFVYVPGPRGKPELQRRRCADPARLALLNGTCQEHLDSRDERHRCPPGKRLQLPWVRLGGLWG